MNSLKKSKSVILFLGAFLSTPFLMAQTPAESGTATVATPQVMETPIYEQLGMSSTALFTVMTIFTFLLLAIMMSMANSTKDILKHKQDQVKKDKSNSLKTLLAVVGLFISGSALAAGESSGESLIPFPDKVFWGYIVVDLVLIMFIIHFAGIIKGTISDQVTLTKRFRWKRIKRNLTDAVPVEEEASILLDHDYDGITELDNNLPPWWKYGFYVTIVWAVFYIFYYQILEIGNLQEAEYLAAMEEGEREMAEYKAAHPEMITAENVELLEDAGGISRGRETFNTYCVSCHGAAGEGGIGPNLTDKYWLYGNDIKGVFTTVSEGAQNGMVAWKTILTADKIQEVASYVLHLDYVAPPTGKDPQGEEK